MNFENCNNDCYRDALKKIAFDQKNRIVCCLGATGPTGPQGLVGETGSTGPTGPQGAAAEAVTLTIGTVTTGNPGTDAAATISGTSPNFILNLTIPQGPTGPTG